MTRVTDRDGTAAPHGSDFLQLRADDVPADGKADWLARQVRLAITGRRLTVGSRLPATRLLAAELRVSRGVVTEAYRRLAEDGHVEGRRRGGTVVVAAPPPPLPSRTRQPPSAGPFAGSPDSRVFDALRAADARIDLTPGRPDLSAFPRTAWLRAERAVLAELSSADLG
ncbi:GntR family transcriptional regulator, partial [Streptomyces griseoincarnatus]